MLQKVKMHIEIYHGLSKKINSSTVPYLPYCARDNTLDSKDQTHLEQIKTNPDLNSSWAASQLLCGICICNINYVSKD